MYQGGGSALQNVLSSVDQTINATHQIIVDDGVYSPISFLTSWFNTLKNKNFIISSINGPENCIIDGGARWIDDDCRISENLLSTGTRCIYAESVNTTGFGLTICGFTLSNGYSDNGSAVFMPARNAKILKNCKIHNCYSSNYAAGISNIGQCLSCEFDRLTALRAVVAAQTLNGIIDCDIKNILAYKDANTGISLFEASKLIRCRIHNVKFCRSMFHYMNGIYQCLIYDLSVVTRYSTERVFSADRSNAIVGNTIIYPNSVTATIDLNNNYNGSGTRIIANNIFAIPTGKLYGSVANQTMSVFNNFCRYVNDTSCYNTITGTDPGFIDVVNLDYHLAANSPCISTGNWSLKQNARDLDGKLYRNPPSIGCYQFYKSIEGEIPNYINPIGIPMYAVVPISAYWGICFIATKDHSTVSMQKVGTPPSVSLEYSKNAVDWRPFVVGSTTVHLTYAKDKVWIRSPIGSTNSAFSLTSDNNYNRFVFSGGIKANGSIMSLVNGASSTTTIPTEACFSSLFRNNKALIEPPQLPATTLKNQCYEYMFIDCTNLQTMPTLPASTVNRRAYRQMFYNCTNLSSDILLPATTVQDQAYERMFQANKKIKTADIRGTSVAYNALWSMFENSSLLSNVSVRFTTWQAANNTWLGGVATTGIFTCPTTLGTNETIERGTNRVPTGWTVVNF